MTGYMQKTKKSKKKITKNTKQVDVLYHLLAFLKQCEKIKKYFEMNHNVHLFTSSSLTQSDSHYRFVE